MKDNNYPGLRPFSKDKLYRPPSFSSKEFEQLIGTPPLMHHDPEGFSNLLSDLQANIVAHHQRDFSRCFFLHFKTDGPHRENIEQALAWLSFVGDKITGADVQLNEIQRLRELRNTPETTERAVPGPKEFQQDNTASGQALARKPVICLYLTWKGYVSLGLEHFAPFDEKGSFEKGMQHSMSFLFGQDSGMRFDEDHDLHAMLLVASDRQDMKDAYDIIFKNQVDLRKGGIPWVDVVIQNGKIGRKTLKNGKKVMVDWFGFRDGISQPRFFPDLHGKKDGEYRESDLTALRTVLVKDKGGRKRFSAGSFMAYLKIRQDTAAFEEMENTIAAHIAVFGLETLLSQMPLQSLVAPGRVEKLLELNAGQDVTINSVLGGAKDMLQAMMGNKSENIRLKIATRIASQPLGKIISINPDKKEELLGEIMAIIRKIRQEEDATKELETLLGTLRQKVVVLKNEAEKPFTHAGVIEQLLLSVGESGPGFNPAEQEIIRDALMRSVSVKAGEKRELIDEMKADNLPALDFMEIDRLLREKIDLAGAYIMGRFRNGTPVATHAAPDDTADDFSEDFRYHKKWILSDKTSAVSHTDGSLEALKKDMSGAIQQHPLDLDDLAAIFAGREKDFGDANRLIAEYLKHAAAKQVAVPVETIRLASGAAPSGGTSSADDLAGMRCPFAAHARKANPRDDRQRRMIARRGVLYEDKTPEGETIDKGMLFLSFQANLTEQFEYILRHWINNVNQDMQMTGVDLLAGTGINREFSRWYFPVEWNGSDPDAKILLTARELPACIHYLEGEYFFAPSISFLKSVRELSTFQPARDGDAQSVAAASTKPVFDGYPIRPVKWLRDNIK